jgi:RNA-directed DNA polymerase
MHDIGGIGFTSGSRSAIPSIGAAESLSRVTVKGLREATRAAARWLRTLHRWNWKDVRRSYTTPQGRWTRPVTADGIELFHMGTVPVTRYRYRGNTIPSPWALNHA